MTLASIRTQDGCSQVSIVSGTEVEKYLTPATVTSLSQVMVEAQRDTPEIRLKDLRYQIANALYRVTFGQGGYLRELIYPYTTDTEAFHMIRKDYLKMAKEGALSAALTAEEKVAGIIGYGQVSNTKDDRRLPVVEMKRLVVLPGHQKQGIGTRLMDTVLERIKDTGAASIIGATRQHAVIRWFTSKAFRAITPEEFWLEERNFNKGSDKGIAWKNLSERIKTWGWKYYRHDFIPKSGILHGPHQFPIASEETPMVRAPGHGPVARQESAPS